MTHLIKKVGGILLLTIALVSCGENPKVEVSVTQDKKAESVQISTEDLGKTQTGFTSDLKDLMDSSYEKAATTTDQK